jgi:hypothetical protein
VAEAPEATIYHVDFEGLNRHSYFSKNITRGLHNLHNSNEKGRKIFRPYLEMLFKPLEYA